ARSCTASTGTPPTGRRPNGAGLTSKADAARKRRGATGQSTRGPTPNLTPTPPLPDTCAHRHSSLTLASSSW
ncbi:hypothetical protein, partial [Clavibacter michiganensis]|uniref:hypothetical protein n=1 Tax=Clavibacter michiganensis TaxID=28447 RepID=UPI0029318D33